MDLYRVWLILVLLVVLAYHSSAEIHNPETCPRPSVGSTVEEPQDLHSSNGILRLELNYYSFVDELGRTRFCFQTSDGKESPTLRVRRGDEVVILLKNKLTRPEPLTPEMSAHSAATTCTSGAMTAGAVNLHFHGLMIAPTCHQDDTLSTAIQPSDPPFEYKFKIPNDQPPGTYWYHPHIHGFTRAHSLGGASGALIVEGIEAVSPVVRDLPERVFVIRDQDLMHPDAEPIWTGPGPAPPVIKDADGDVINTGTGTGKPAKDLSINYVPVPFPDYKPAVIMMRSRERQFWRVLNASAITYVDLRFLYSGQPQTFDLVAIDGIPLNYEKPENPGVIPKNHLILPPAGRAEFVITAPPPDVKGVLVTRSVDTGRVGDNAPVRQIAEIRTQSDAPEPSSQLSRSKGDISHHTSVPLSRTKPVRERLLYFSERPSNPDDPNSPTMFFITVEGQEPKPFDPASHLPNITVHAGDVEDWIIENRTLELHAFHIHQTHFQLLELNGIPVEEPFLYDTVNVPYWKEKMRAYPGVKVRIDFRSPSIVGTFAYHCHLLEHQDGGMMGLIRVLPAERVKDLRR